MDRGDRAYRYVTHERNVRDTIRVRHGMKVGLRAEDATPGPPLPIPVAPARRRPIGSICRFGERARHSLRPGA